MVILDKERLYAAEDIMKIQNKLLEGILACRTSEAVEACVTYARFLNKTGLTNENYPLFIKLLEVGNHWVVDGLIGDRDPFLFLSSIQPNHQILAACFGLLAERHPGGIYTKSLSVILGVLQAAYNVPEDGYNIYPLTISDINALGKHLDDEAGQEDSLNRCILDILEKISLLKGMTSEDREKEELAIHGNEIRSFFFDDRKNLSDVIPPVLLVRMSYQDFEVSPRKENQFPESGDNAQEEEKTEPKTVVPSKKQAKSKRQTEETSESEKVPAEKIPAEKA